MASPSSCTKPVLILLTILSSLHFFYVSSFEFQVGDNSGWIVPPPNDTQIYNDWAYEKKFKVGDTVRFKYRKDSVMEVSEAEYKECNSTPPSFFSKNGNTVLKLDRPGFFYIISGANGLCDKGQRMIIKVMSHGDSGNTTTTKSAGISSSAGSVALSFGLTKSAAVLLYFVSYHHL